VIDPVEEFLQIHIHDDPVAVLHVALCRQHCVMRATSRPEAMAVIGECRVNFGLQNLQQGLLDQPIRHRRYAQFAQASVRFRYLHALHRRRPVAAVQERFPYLRPLRFEVLRRFGDRPSIHPGTAAIGFDAFPRRHHVRARECLLKQAASPQASGFMSRRPRFITHSFGIGFTSPFRDAPRLPGLLMPCSFERHGLQLSFSFGPSPLVGSYYGLC
jgi:hypothetical protein